MVSVCFARHSQLRKSVLTKELAARVDFERLELPLSMAVIIQIILFGVKLRLSLAAEAIKPYWANGPKAVDQRQWKEIIGDQPTLILLTSCLHILDNASTQVFGQGTPANMAAYSLSPE